MTLRGEVDGGLARPMYVIMMSGDRMSFPKQCEWVTNLRIAAAHTVERCDRFLGGSPAGLDGKPRLGLATTRELLLEIKARGEMEPRYETEGGDMAIGAANLLAVLPGSMLDYRTVDL